MDLTHTSTHVVNRAAAILGKYVVGEALGAIEYDTIDRCIDDVLAEIAKIVAIGDRDEIPNTLFETIARLVSVYAAADFSNQPLDLGAVQQLEARLRYLVAQTPTYEVLAPYFF